MKMYAVVPDHNPTPDAAVYVDRSFALAANRCGELNELNVKQVFAVIEVKVTAAGEPTRVERDVRAFHEKFQIPVANSPSLLEKEIFQYRAGFLHEELGEFVTAHQRGDLPEAADGLVDLVYVAVGTALYMGLDFTAHWDAVQRANMAKMPGAAAYRPYVPPGHDLVKPDGWSPPDHAAIIAVTRGERR